MLGLQLCALLGLRKAALNKATDKTIYAININHEIKIYSFTGIS